MYYFVPYFIQYDTYTNVKLPFFSPICTVPKQNNAVDCGVYVCRYALALYQLRYLPITYKDLYLSDPPLSVLTKSSSFDFTHHTIKQLRQHMTKLLQNLSTLYLSNTVHIDTSQPEASAEESTPTQPVDQLVLIPPSDKMRLSTFFMVLAKKERRINAISSKITTSYVLSPVILKIEFRQHTTHS